MGKILNVYETLPALGPQLDCVEVYVPKTIKYQSDLYSLLDKALSDRRTELSLNGVSIYEVDGVFRGITKVWEERVLVIRCLIPRPVEGLELSVQAKVRELGSQIANAVARKEEELWICYYPLNVAVFRPSQPPETKREN